MTKGKSTRRKLLSALGVGSIMLFAGCMNSSGSRTQSQESEHEVSIRVHTDEFMDDERMTELHEELDMDGELNQSAEQEMEEIRQEARVEAINAMQKNIDSIDGLEITESNEDSEYVLVSSRGDSVLEALDSEYVGGIEHRREYFKST